MSGNAVILSYIFGLGRVGVYPIHPRQGRTLRRSNCPRVTMADKDWPAGGKFDSCAGRRVPDRKPFAPLGSAHGAIRDLFAIQLRRFRADHPI